MKKECSVEIRPRTACSPALTPQQEELRFKSQFGHTHPDEKQPVECACGWHGTIAETNCQQYSSGGNSWRMLAGRSGLHWHCPQCDEVVWRYYHMVS